MPQSEKKKLPACPWYFGDWKKCPEVQALDLDIRMIWFEMLGFMWESDERGYFTLNSEPISLKQMANMIKISTQKAKSALAKMKKVNLFSVREDGAIYCRRMVKDEAKRVAFVEFGKKGGNPSLGRDKGGVNPKDKGGVNRGGYPSSENETESEKGVEGKEDLKLPADSPNTVNSLIDDEIEKRKGWLVQPEDM